MIRKTNGSAAARELYDSPAGIVIYAQAPSRVAQSLVGRFIFTLEYEFSGRRDPLGPEAAQPQATTSDAVVLTGSAVRG